jgi:hypothetical protein
MATCREQHEAVPDRIVKAEALQEMKDRAERVQDAPDREQPQARAREDGCERVVRHDTAPTKQQAKNDGKAIERPGRASFRAIPMPALNQTPMPKLAEYARFTGMLRSTQRRSLNLSPGNQCPQRRRPRG